MTWKQLCRIIWMIAIFYFSWKAWNEDSAWFWFWFILAITVINAWYDDKIWG